MVYIRNATKRNDCIVVVSLFPQFRELLFLVGRKPSVVSDGGRSIFIGVVGRRGAVQTVNERMAGQARVTDSSASTEEMREKVFSANSIVFCILMSSHPNLLTILHSFSH